MTSRLPRVRTRLALGSGLAGLALTASLAVAPPAGAQAEPAVEPASPLARAIETSWFTTPIAAVVRALDAAEGGPAAKAELAAVRTNGCVDAGPANSDVPRMVAEIFVCRALEAGYSREEARQIAAEAVTVAACESAFKKNAVVFDGKYLNSPHPRTGYRYSAAGVFQFIRATADKWIEGGYANVLRPRRNIDAAARLYLHNRATGLRGWEDWACVAVNDGFADHAVIPGWPGGPAELPSWSWKLADAALA